MLFTDLSQLSRSSSSGSQPENSPEMIIFKIHRDVVSGQRAISFPVCL